MGDPLEVGWVGAEPTAPTFELSGGAVCLDLVNTLGGRELGNETEAILGYDDLLAFAGQAGLVNEAARARLASIALERPDEAAAVRARAAALREALWRIFARYAAVGEGQVPEPPSVEDLAAVNDEVARVGARARLVPGRAQFQWAWADEPDDLSRPLWPIVRSATELLTGDDLAFIRICAASDCNWVFLDRSKNHRRQWCDMRVCGNRAKARRYQERKRASRGG